MPDNDPVYVATLNAVRELLQAELDKLPEYSTTGFGLTLWADLIVRTALANNALPTAKMIHDIVETSAPLLR
jgi:hypothetical protein